MAFVFEELLKLDDSRIWRACSLQPGLGNWARSVIRNCPELIMFLFIFSRRSEHFFPDNWIMENFDEITFWFDFFQDEALSIWRGVRAAASWIKREFIKAVSKLFLKCQLCATPEARPRIKQSFRARVVYCCQFHWKYSLIFRKQNDAKQSPCCFCCCARQEWCFL